MTRDSLSKRISRGQLIAPYMGSTICGDNDVERHICILLNVFVFVFLSPSTG